MINKELKKLSKDGYDISEAREFDWPHFRGVGESIREMCANLEQDEERGLVFFSGKRSCNVVPNNAISPDPYTSFSIEKQGLIMGLSKEIYIPCAYRDGLAIYSTEDQRRGDNTRIEFPFKYTDIHVCESGMGPEIYLFDQKNSDRSSPSVNFCGVREMGDSDESFKESEEKGMERYIYFKIQDNKSIFFLPNAKISPQR